MQFNQNDTSTFIYQADSTAMDSVLINDIDSMTSVPQAYISIFETEKVAKDLSEKPLSSQHHPFWVPSILVLGFILIAWGRLFFRRRLEMIFRGIFARNIANQVIREGNLFNERIGLILFLVYLLSMAMFIYLALPLFNVNFGLSPGMTYLSIFGFFLSLWIFKVFFIRLLSVLFNTDDHSRNLLANMYLYNLFAGIVLLPATICIAFAELELFFYISLVIIAFIYTLRLIREAIIGITIIKFSVFHLILYLCTLEILPLIVLAKILTRNMILL